MFRRHWSGLPKESEFPSTLKELGYFINDDDEIRSIEKPDCYFRHRANHNERVNSRLRFHFNREHSLMLRLAPESPAVY